MIDTSPTEMLLLIKRLTQIGIALSSVRDRDTLEQVRMTEDEVVRFLDDKVNG